MERYRKKIKLLPELIRIAGSWKSPWLNLGLCHGCFDILGPGHIEHFRWAKERCNCLFVTISSDDVVAKTKGEGRPIMNEQQRILHIAALEDVDFCAIDPNMTAEWSLREIRPDFYFKGYEFKKRKTPALIREMEVIEGYGGTIIYSPDVETFHTTDIVKTIQKLETNGVDTATEPGG